jgi:hypothetical protein
VTKPWSFHHWLKNLANIHSNWPKKQANIHPNWPKKQANIRLNWPIFLANLIDWQEYSPVFLLKIA